MTTFAVFWILALVVLVLLSWLRGLREDEERERNRLASRKAGEAVENWLFQEEQQRTREAKANE